MEEHQVVFFKSFFKDCMERETYHTRDEVIMADGSVWCNAHGPRKGLPKESIGHPDLHALCIPDSRINILQKLLRFVGALSHHTFLVSFASASMYRGSEGRADRSSNSL